MFAGLSSKDLRYLAGALFQGRLHAPYTEASLSRLEIAGADAVVGDLTALAEEQFSAQQIARLIEALASERASLEHPGGRVEIVATGPETEDRARDTAVVIEQLFAEARSRVLVVGFALYGGQKIFKTLADRMDAEPGLDATCCFDISRQGNDTTRDADLVDRFADRFVRKEWPGRRLPAVFYDPRGLSTVARQRAVLHAKTIVIDGFKAIVTSANPTQAAYSRNIELGVIFNDKDIAGLIEGHFRGLIRNGFLRPVHLKLAQTPS
jgi:phosphatidylserine/phosphatidylglycerophosphate/cardiolipin synthase-like enzyme